MAADVFMLKVIRHLNKQTNSFLFIVCNKSNILYFITWVNKPRFFFPQNHSIWTAAQIAVQTPMNYG